MKTLALLIVLVLCGCETVRFGVSYQGKYANYQVSRTFTQGARSWDALIDANGKEVKPLHPSK